MQIRQLEHMLALAKTGSFSEAAKTQHLTQSALSKSIKSLEDELGGPLFDRVGKRSMLTPLGEMLMGRASALVLQAAEFKRAVQLFKEGTVGTLRVGMASGPAALLLSPLLRMMAAEHPSIRLEVLTDSMQYQMTLLRQRKLDAVLADIGQIHNAPDLTIQMLPPVKVGALVRAGHPLAQKKDGVYFRELLDYPIASTQLGERIAQVMVQEWGKEADPAQCVTLISQNVGSLLYAVEHTNTVFLGSVSAAKRDIAEGRIVALTILPLLEYGFSRYTFVTLSQRMETPALKLLREFAFAELHD